MLVGYTVYFTPRVSILRFLMGHLRSRGPLFLSGLCKWYSLIWNIHNKYVKISCVILLLLWYAYLSFFFFQTIFKVKFLPYWKNMCKCWDCELEEIAALAFHSVSYVTCENIFKKLILVFLSLQSTCTIN